MQTRTLGETGHESSLAMLGTAAFGRIPQDEVDQVVALALDAGVNHVDVAPSYGEAELRLGPWASEFAARGVFVACKTEKREQSDVRRELEESLGQLAMEKFPLYQLHAVTSLQELDLAMVALDALVDARREGLIDHIGITGHGLQSPAVMLEAMARFDFATIMFPVNAALWARSDYRKAAEKVLRTASEKRVGVLAIKTAVKGPWTDRALYQTWYEPFEESDEIAAGVRFTLSQEISALCTPGDARLLPMVLEAVSAFNPMSDSEQERLITARSDLVSIF